MDEPTIHVEVTPAPTVETEVEEAEETIDEITDVSEQLALHSIISEERHDQILERVAECQTRLDQLSQTESPTLSAMQREIQEIRSELLNLKSLMVSMQSNPTPSRSVQPEAESPEELAPVESIEEPERAEPLPENQPPKKKLRIL